MKVYLRNMKALEITEGNVDPDDTLPGVVACNSLKDDFRDLIYYGKAINLTSQRWAEDFEQEHGELPTEEDWDDYNPDEEEWLIGDWRMTPGSTGWAPDPEGDYGFSAVIGWLGGASLVTVVAGKSTTHVASMCSPCCPGQADIDSGGSDDGWQCYCLPSSYFLAEVNHAD